MDVSLQSKLLRVLQEREFVEVGAIEPKPFKGQIISAAQNSLEEAVQTGQFRDDLRYRLEVISLHLPPLRERSEDVLPLFQSFLRESTRSDQDVALEPEVETAIERCFWPGNIRQLQNTALYAKAMFDGQLVRLADLPANVSRHLGSPETRRRAEDQQQKPSRRASDLDRRASDKPRRRKSDRRERVVDMSREQIEELLKRNRGVRAKAAKELGVSRMTLWRAMKRHGLTELNPGE